MGLRELAERDLGVIMEDGAYGPAWPVTLTDPAGNVSTGLYGLSNDISQVVDPDTGQLVSGRVASVAFRTSTLQAQGFSMPQGIHDQASLPWRVTFNDINGGAHSFKVRQTDPDRTLGIVVCILEAWTP